MWVVMTVVAQQALGDEAVLRAGGLTVWFETQTRTLKVADDEAGVLLERGVVRARVGGREVSSADAQIDCRCAAHAERAELVLNLMNAFDLRIRVTGAGQLEAVAEGALEGPAQFDAHASGGERAMAAILKDETSSDRGVLITVLGEAGVPGMRSLFDPERDLAVTVQAGGGVRWSRQDGWALHTEAPVGQSLLSLRVRRHYYRNELGIQYYAPLRKRLRWPTAPVVAMTWYGIEGWNGRPAQRKEWLYPQIDWVAQHLLPYAGSMVFQLDDNYPERDDRSMREFSDYIRSKGLIPGIWFTPYTVAPKEEGDTHPEWFLHDADGKPLGTFGGVSYAGKLQDHRNHTLNVTNPEAVERWFGMWWRKASETWNYEFFKIDGQPDVIAAYRKSKNGGGVEGYRKGLQTGRSIVGPEKFINACWGIPLEAIGLVDGSRTGGDTGNDPHAMDVIIRWNFLNNVVWWCDPDAAANLFRATVERARFNAQARVLTGQQFLTDDVWTKVPPEVRRVWQRSYPTLDIRPVNLYPIEDWKRYDLFDLRIARRWGTWDVVGLFNYDGKPAEKVLDLVRLPLDGEPVHVFEFWTSTYLGRVARDAKITRLLAPYEGQLFSMVPSHPDRPVLISTSRHASQGGLDLVDLTWLRNGTRWIAKGTSTHLVAGDPYELAFTAGRFAITEATCTAGPVRTARGGGLLRAAVKPNQSGSAEWQVTFEPVGRAGFDVVPACCDLRRGQIAELEIVGLGPEEVAWKAVPSDRRIRVSPESGRTDPWPARAKLSVSVDATELEPGKIWSGQVTIEGQGEIIGSPARVEVRTMTPMPDNLALRAKATASSIWASDFRAEYANDGKPNTRWNSREGDKDGCWIEFAWPEPVVFDRVVIDECTDWGQRIQGWHLHAGVDRLSEVAQGTTVGRNHAVDIPKPTTAKRLRLTIDKASVVPTIWEVEVYRWKKGP